MKSLKSLMVLAVLALTFATSAKAANIALTDPSLEAAFGGNSSTVVSGWFTFGSTGAANDVYPGTFWGTASGMANRNGNRAAYAVNIGASDGGSIYQRVTLDAGVTYTMTVGVGMSAAVTKGDAKFALVFFNSGFSTLLAETTGTITTRGSFADYSVTFTPSSSGDYQAGLRCRGYATGTESTVFFDNVRLVAVANKTVTYNGNGSDGGTVPVDGSSPYIYGATVTVAGPGTMTRAGFAFTGWNTQSNGSGTGYSAANTFTVTTNTTLYAQWTAATATITAPATFPGAVTTTYGTVSSSTSVSVSGANLTSDITATAPANFEVSSDNSTFGTTATFVQSGGSASGSLYVRLKNNAPVSGTYNSQNVTLTSSGATTVIVATTASGNSVAAKALTVVSAAAQDKIRDGTTAATVTGSLSTAEAFGAGNNSDGKPYIGDTLIVTCSGSMFASASVGAGIAVTHGTFGLGGSSAGNYTVTQPSFTSLTASIVDTAVWTSIANGSWPTAGNWQNGVVGTGVDNTADFSTLDLTAAVTLTLDGARTIGGLKFGDTTPSHNWTIATGTGGPLTLDVTTGSPVVNVGNQIATIGVVVAGNDGLTKTGNGTLNLTALNTFSGVTTINGGTLGAAMSPDFGASHVGSSIVINTNGTLQLNENHVTGFAYSLAGNRAAANATINAGGTFNLNGHSTYLENLTLLGMGQVSGLGEGSGTGLRLCANVTATSDATGAPSISSMALVGGTYTDAGNVHTLTVIHGAGSTSTSDLTVGKIDELTQAGATSLIKAGNGTLTLSAVNTYAGATTVSNGTLKVTGSLAGGAVSVEGGAVLAGNGTIGGAVVINSGATLTPNGTFPATLTVNNTLNVAGTSSFRINATQSDSVAGVSTFTSGGTLDITLESGSLSGGETFTLVSATIYGGVAPTAGTLPTLGSGLNWYLGNLPVNGSITVNRAPTASALTLGVAQGGSATLTIIGGKNAPTDADGNALTITSVGSTTLAGSSVVAAGGGTGVTYTAPNNVSGADSFTYTVSDGRGGTVVATVTVTVSPASTGANLVSGSLNVSGGIATMQALGLPGAYYHLQYTTSLSPVSWLDVTDADVQANPGNGTMTLTDSGASGPMRYYRTRYVSGP